MTNPLLCARSTMRRYIDHPVKNPPDGKPWWPDFLMSLVGGVAVFWLGFCLFSGGWR